MMFLSTRTAVLIAMAVNSLVGVTSAIPLLGSAKAEVYTHCVQDNWAALSFDDGPAVSTRKAMELLEAVGARGTFFVNGNNWGCIYDKADVVQETIRRGHQVASHTWSHKHLNSLSYNDVKTELTRTHQAIKQITGADVAFMRPPYGEYNDNVLRVAGDLRETVVTWNLDSGDGLGHSLDQQVNEFKQAVKEKRKGIISLQHDVHPDSINKVLPQAIQILRGAKYQLVTVAQCLGMQPYHSVGSPASDKSDWHC
ncbi:hypothetical protein NP233_g1482 [Leucocoprinus birnbaumii]|uniref:NodB homology domain-containing protein n=1 Tax=Leucocoprinus birnbaumii TaxID=56174 RepID=A0AAD5YZI6_9AGAR|nr:hypothetical protein NP233_g1482 [Leucocoprinus birnbaumii]